MRAKQVLRFLFTVFLLSLEIHQLASNMSGYGSIYGDDYGGINGRRSLIRPRLVKDNEKGKDTSEGRRSDHSQQNYGQKNENITQPNKETPGGEATANPN